MWDYAHMVHIAKECGGPEMFMQCLIETGRSQMKPIIYSAGGAGLLLGLTIGIVGCVIIKDCIDTKKKVKNIQYEGLERIVKLDEEQSLRAKTEIEFKEQKEEV